MAAPGYVALNRPRGRIANEPGANPVAVNEPALFGVNVNGT